MKTKVEVITPEIATDILENHNPRNRRVSEPTVEAYASDMKQGRWVLNHQGIAFDEEGNLIDGQHRLWAIVFANVSVEMMVTRDIPVSELKNGVELNPMDSIDRNRVRTTGQQMQLCHGIKNGSQVAAAVRGIALMISPNDGQKKLTTSTSLFIYDQYGRDIESIIQLLDSRQRVSHMMSPIAMYHHGEPQRAQEFCRQYRTMEDMADAVRATRKYIEQQYGRGNQDLLLRVVSNGLHHFHQGSKIKQLQDNPRGMEFLIGMFPSMNKRIKEAVRVVKINRDLNRKIKAE